MRNTCAKPITSWNSPATERLTRFLEAVFSNVLLKLPSWQPTNRNLPRHFFAPICNASKNVTKAFKGQSQHFLENSKKVWKEFGPLLFAVLILGTNTLVNITISVHKVVIRKKILQHYMIILWTTDIIWLKEKVNREKIMSKYTKTTILIPELYGNWISLIEHIPRVALPVYMLVSWPTLLIPQTADKNQNKSKIN